MTLTPPFGQNVFLVGSTTRTLDERLQTMTWLRSPRTRRPNPGVFTRRGGRYRAVQDHGTASRIRGIRLAHQNHAELHSNGVWYETARREKAAFLARRANLAWWDQDDPYEDFADWCDDYDWFAGWFDDCL